MSASANREPTWRHILNSRADSAVRLRCGIVVSMIVAGGFGARELIDAFYAGTRKELLARAPELLPASNPNGGLVIDPGSLSLGDSWNADRWTCTLVVRNPTDRDVRVKDWPGPNRFHARPDRVTVPRGESVSIDIEFDPTMDDATDLSSLTSLVRRRFRPIIKDEPGLHPGWVIEGWLHRALAIPTDYVTISDQPLQRDVELPTVSVPVMALRSIKSLTADTGPDQLAAVVSGPSAGNRYEVLVTPLPSAATGRHTLPVTLRAELPDGVTATAEFNVGFWLE